MSTQIPEAARPILVWMSANRERLAALVTEEVGADGDLSPESDGSIRAHLRFVAEAMANTAEPADPSLERFAASAGEALDAERFADYAGQLGEAHAHIAQSQFGDGAGDDPLNREVIDRRVRINAWIRVFVDALDAARAPAEPVGPAINSWMHGEERRLANTIFAMDRRAKEVEIERGNQSAVDDAGTSNTIGRAAMVQAHMRFLVEAIGETGAV